MTRLHRRLLYALASSLLLHALALAPLPMPSRKAVSSVVPLEAKLQPPPVATEEAPTLLLPPPAKPKDSPIHRQSAVRPGREPAKSASHSNWTAEVRKQLKELDKQGRFYPEEAIAQGIEGEALVLLVLDETGNAAAARLEQSSGHRILDDAAVRAVRTLKSLPATAPREVLLPVRFRLR